MSLSSRALNWKLKERIRNIVRVHNGGRKECPGNHSPIKKNCDESKKKTKKTYTDSSVEDEKNKNEKKSVRRFRQNKDGKGYKVSIRKVSFRWQIRTGKTRSERRKDKGSLSVLFGLQVC